MHHLQFVECLHCYQRVVAAVRVADDLHRDYRCVLRESNFAVCLQCLLVQFLDQHADSWFKAGRGRCRQYDMAVESDLIDLTIDVD